MPRGPLPNPNRRRRNAPTIPTSNLPAGGFAGEPLPVPSWVTLGKAGKAWWRWAWKTPQAAAWGSGVEVHLARRAALEDDLAALDAAEGLDLDEALDAPHLQAVRSLVQRLAALATGRLTIMREMRDLEDRLGLSPKAMAALRWVIVADEEPAEAESDADEVAEVRALHAV